VKGAPHLLILVLHELARDPGQIRLVNRDRASSNWGQAALVAQRTHAAARPPWTILAELT
jgi:hypothetical protein